MARVLTARGERVGGGSAVLDPPAGGQARLHGEIPAIASGGVKVLTKSWMNPYEGRYEGGMMNPYEGDSM